MREAVDMVFAFYSYVAIEMREPWRVGEELG